LGEIRISNDQITQKPDFSKLSLLNGKAGKHDYIYIGMVKKYSDSEIDELVQKLF
jgi:hypothetical protein